MASSFNPLEQTVTLLTPSAPISIPITAIDAFNDESISVTINYAFQMGACSILLLVMLIMTPPAKLSRPSSILHMAGLATCLVRTSLLEAFFLSPLNHFYQFWSGDYSSVPQYYLRSSVAGTCFSLLLVMIIEAALMHQAWTMVSLWPAPVKASLVVVSGIISLLAVGWRLALAIVQSKATMDLVPASNMAWLVRSALVLSCLSISWYCALFNVKLAWHLLSNRGILRYSYSSSSSSSAAATLSPMEVLVMTNGLLMIVPVIFAGLEWGHFPNFEAASLTHTSVAIILPLGTLAAQQITRGTSLAYLSSGRGTGSDKSAKSSNTREKSTAVTAANFPSVSTMCGSSSPNRMCLLSQCHVPESRAQGLDHFDLELRQIDSASALADRVRVDTDLQQEETRI
ncbi:hypothetical protein C2857_007390 [Epichloe festucae Fl1]|uniref:Pheromone receptor n=1 Tax=Epichloe festucae (strain Fl1) TaxID=877507 RepID=A0A7S9KQS1_EPIFF|nr:hypothetical protein C2857_007390 [Epichloe festucae Fl1]